MMRKYSQELDRISVAGSGWGHYPSYTPELLIQTKNLRALGYFEDKVIIGMFQGILQIFC